MFVNPEGSKINQLQPDIGRTMPQQDLKLGQKMMYGGPAKNMVLCMVVKFIHNLEKLSM